MSESDLSIAANAVGSFTAVLAAVLLLARLFYRPWPEINYLNPLIDSILALYALLAAAVGVWLAMFRQPREFLGTFFGLMIPAVAAAGILLVVSIMLARLDAARKEARNPTVVADVVDRCDCCGCMLTGSSGASSGAVATRAATSPQKVVAPAARKGGCGVPGGGDEMTLTHVHQTGDTD
ncbi:hypothetical protein [uncultured Microbacterium sp.]|uniref:hypothetical protein n=1 Tax=uncultured Microbacterium sp. TaxID=191216 RepID=UPI0025DF0889|nr:hypothetical protein [uncultured Microbacterium sp.]